MGGVLERRGKVGVILGMPITKAQIKYLEILFNDLGYDRIQRNVWLSNRLGWDVRFLDNLTGAEASKIIDELKKTKEDAGEGL